MVKEKGEKEIEKDPALELIRKYHEDIKETLKNADSNHVYICSENVADVVVDLGLEDDYVEGKCSMCGAKVMMLKVAKKARVVCIDCGIRLLMGGGEGG